MRVFAFLDLNHPPVAWAVMRGMLISADHAAPSTSTGFVSFMMAGMIQHQNNRRIFNELIVEYERAIRFPDRVSRLAGMYFFPTRAEARARIGDSEWPAYFIAENLVEFELDTPSAPTMVDANWITHAPRAEDGRILTDDLTWIQKYWNSEPFSHAPVWELISNGVAVVLDTNVRRHCFIRSVLSNGA